MRVEIFISPRCPRCPRAKKLGERLKREGWEVKYFNLETPEGLAEAAYRDVLSTPSLILRDEEGREVKSWKGEIPGLEELRKWK